MTSQSNCIDLTIYHNRISIFLPCKAFLLPQPRIQPASSLYLDNLAHVMFSWSISGMSSRLWPSLFANSLSAKQHIASMDSQRALQLWLLPEQTFCVRWVEARGVRKWIQMVQIWWVDQKQGEIVAMRNTATIITLSEERPLEVWKGSGWYRIRTMSMIFISKKDDTCCEYRSYHNTHDHKMWSAQYKLSTQHSA